MSANPVRAGLTTTQARSRLAADGANELPTARPHGAWRLLREVVSEPMFLLLVGCGAIYMLLGDRNEALMLLGFVFVVIGITFGQQRRTERSLDALRDMSSPQALAVRDGVAARIPSRELVCGDVVLLAEGDRVAADIELLDASNLTIDESMLTGESVPVSKFVRGNATAGSLDTPGAADIRVFSGTLVISPAAIRIQGSGARPATRSRATERLRSAVHCPWSSALCRWSSSRPGNLALAAGEERRSQCCVMERTMRSLNPLAVLKAWVGQASTANYLAKSDVLLR
jgi:magnesium-transporting ATPase (P-type)